MEQGIARLGSAIAENCRQANRFAQRLAKEPRIEIAHPTSLNIVCCRYIAPQLDEAATDALNAAVVISMQERGVAVASTRRIGGRLCIRICVTNHRSRDADFERLAQELVQTGARLAGDRAAGP